jgi:hypothetical protein
MKEDLESETDIIDIEEFVLAGKEIPHGKKYRIRIDKIKYTVNIHSMTGRQLLVLAGKNPPERFRIDQKLQGGQTKRIGLDEAVDFTRPGVERFMTMPLDQTDGEVRRQFQLPEEDTEYLTARGLPWETIFGEGGQWLILRDFPVPSGYNTERVAVAIQITPGYPSAPLDMAYFYPHLCRSNNRGISALSPHNLDGKTWQRWSRHRTPENPWRAGEDSIVTHLALVEWWLEKEAREN